MWTLPRIKIRRNFLPLQAVDFVHFCRKCVNKSGECLGVCVFHLLPKSPHYPLDMRRSWISINSLRLDGPESLDILPTSYEFLNFRLSDQIKCLKILKLFWKWKWYGVWGIYQTFQRRKYILFVQKRCFLQLKYR